MKRLDWLPPEEHVDPLFVQQCVLGNSPVVPLLGKHFIHPTIALRWDSTPNFVMFASRLNTRCLQPHCIAALYCAVRLFGEQWREFVVEPRVSSPLDEQLDAVANEQMQPCELYEILRVFRAYGSTRQKKSQQKFARDVIGPAFQVFVGPSGQACLGVTDKTDAVRIASFWAAVVASPRLAVGQIDEFCSILARFSFRATEFDKKRVCGVFRIKDSDKTEQQEKWAKIAISSFYKRAKSA